MTASTRPFRHHVPVAADARPCIVRSPNTQQQALFGGWGPRLL